MQRNNSPTCVPKETRSEHFNAPRIMGLEDVEYIEDDELVEITPQNVRIRK